MKRITVHRLLDSEHAYARAKHGENSMLDMELSDHEFLAILVEEVGDVADALNERMLKNADATDEHLAHEIVQVMAVAGAWLLRLPDPSGEESPDARG